MRAMLSMVAASLIGLASPALASPEEEARVVLNAWSEAYAARDYVAMGELHAPMARVRGADVLDYFGRGAISEFYRFDAQEANAQSLDKASYDCQVFDDGIFPNYLTAVCFGRYTLSQTLLSGGTRVRPARFSMTLVGEDSRWMIYDHNTTWMPAVLADCGTTEAADTVAIASGTASPAASDLCSDSTKKGALGTPSPNIPIAAETIVPIK